MLTKLLLTLFPLLRLTLWAAGDGDPGAADDPPAGEAGDTDPPTGGAPQPGDAKFTQADVNRFAGRARKEALQSWAKEHGFSDAKEVEDLIKLKKEADDKAKTDLTKANEKAKRESERAEAAEKRMYGLLLKAEFRVAAADQVSDLDLAYLAAQDLGLLNGDSGLEVDLETATVKGLDKAIEKLLKQKPILKKGQAAALPAGTGGAAGGSTPPGEMTEAEKVAYRQRFGIR